MIKTRLPILALCAMLLATDLANAQAAGPGPTNPNCAIPFDTVNPTGGAVLGQIRYCLTIPLNNQVASSNSAFNIGAQLTTPVFFPLLATITTQLGFTATAGCTLLGNAISTSNVGAGAAVGFQISTVRAFTMTASVCYGYVEAKVFTTTPATTYYDYLLPFVINANDAVRNQVEVQCGSTSTVNSNLPYVSPCAAPTIDNQVRLCDHSSFSAACNTATFGIASWPTLTLAGSIAAALSGTLTVHQDPLTGTLSLNVASWPTLTLGGTISAIESGAITVHQDPITGNLGITTLPDIHLCGQGPGCSTFNTTANMSINGNIGVNNTIPDTFHLCGAKQTNGSCVAIENNNAVTSVNGASVIAQGFLQFWPILLFLASYLLPKTLGSNGAFAGTAIRTVSLLAFALLPDLPTAARLPVVVLALIVLAAEVFTDPANKPEPTGY